MRSIIIKSDKILDGYKYRSYLVVGNKWKSKRNFFYCFFEWVVRTNSSKSNIAYKPNWIKRKNNQIVYGGSNKHITLWVITA